jgi:dihydrodipicolinate synthase/N-acetylneuraminate lyase
MIRGSLVPNITIFHPDGSLDLENSTWHMRWMFEKGANGLFLTGSYGAGPMMTHDERVSVYYAAKEAATGFDGRIILPHVGCIDTRSTVELAKAADALGVDAIGAVPPFYYKHAEPLVLEFYRAIVDAVKTPVFAYNNPETSRFTFSLNTVRKLQEMGLAGLKDSPVEVGFVSNVYYEAKLAGRDFQMILGTSKGWLPFYYMGIEAMIAGMNNWAPEVITELITATFAGDVPRSERAYVQMLDLSRKLHFTDSTIASHMALYARGYYAGFPRLPMALPPFDDPKYLEIRESLKRGFAALELDLSMGDDKSVL